MTIRDYPRGRSGADAALLAALAAGATVEQAAKQAGVSVSTVTRRQRRPEFVAELAEARADVVSRAVGRLSAASVVAADTLLALATSAKSEAIKLSAARAILETGARLREQLELAARLEALEALVKDWPMPPAEQRQGRWGR